jgi:RNA polymerase sigma factor (sigma-70 family)
LGDDPDGGLFQTWKMSAAPQLAEELFNEHHRRIYLYCLRQLGSPEEAEDAVQATYLNACRSLMDGFEPEAAQAWLFKVAHNVCLTRRRSSYRRARVERPQDLQAVQDVVAAPETAGDELFGLDEALASLPEQQRRAILLREWNGLSYREVAAKLGLTQAAVETLIFRARRSLASSLERPAQHRRRVMHSLNAGALLSSLKTLLAGNIAASVATAVAVAASATALTAATVRRGDDFPSHATPVPQIHKPKPAAPHTRLADRSPTPVPAVVDAGSSSNAGGNGKGRGATHRQAHGKAKGKANGKANGKAKPKHANQGHRSGHAQPANSSGPAAPPGQVKSALNGRSAAAPAYGQSGKKS